MVVVAATTITIVSALPDVAEEPAATNATLLLPHMQQDEPKGMLVVGETPLALHSGGGGDGMYLSRYVPI